MARVTGERLESEEERESKARRVDEAHAARAAGLIDPAAAGPDRGGRPKNPRAVFLLSPPRSGSTLLRVMLAGNPRLFAPPELELLGFNTCERAKEAFSGRWELWQEGTIRALMEVRGCTPTRPGALMEEREGRAEPVKDFYRRAPGAGSASRLLVDKTPSYSLDPATLERAEEDFDGAALHPPAAPPLRDDPLLREGQARAGLLPPPRTRSPAASWPS